MIAFLIVKGTVTENGDELVVLEAKVYDVIKPANSHYATHWILTLDQHLTDVIQAMVGFEYQDEAEVRNEVWDVINTSDCEVLIARIE